MAQFSIYDAYLEASSRKPAQFSRLKDLAWKLRRIRCLSARQIPRKARHDAVVAEVDPLAGQGCTCVGGRFAIDFALSNKPVEFSTVEPGRDLANRKDRFMTTQERAMEVAKLRLRFQMNGRLRLESLAALSKVFREYNEPIREELLGSIVFAVPEELLGPADPNMHAQFSETYRLANAPAYPPVLRPRRGTSHPWLQRPRAAAILQCGRATLQRLRAGILPQGRVALRPRQAAASHRLAALRPLPAAILPLGQREADRDIAVIRIFRRSR